MSEDGLESPRKRLKHVANDQEKDTLYTQNEVLAFENSTMNPASQPAQATQESDIGITDYVSVNNRGFWGVLKKRYTDFLVNEILPDGRVVHLRRLGLAKTSAVDDGSENTDYQEAQSLAPEPQPIVDNDTNGSVDNSKAELEQVQVSANGDDDSIVRSSSGRMLRMSNSHNRFQ